MTQIKLKSLSIRLISLNNIATYPKRLRFWRGVSRKMLLLLLTMKIVDKDREDDGLDLGY